ncbi:MAG: tRNA uridine-5-carboxymethylaminomethyl(34) synthesis GTPase MnmE [Gallionella sp.]|nr:tRNA uridine-5-carboxymethylaminomethyl(34) synthesis GTPase MnmE [Gallionella sp.]
MPNIDTIVAISTAAGRGGVGIVRVSGTKAASIAHQFLGKAPIPRHAHFADFPDENGQSIDQGIILFFVAPHSYTGEDVLELQGHGGVAVLQLILRRCISLGARLAEPGEFTRRAYLNNKIDLAQAEAVADLIDATTAQAARSAMRSLHGEFSSVVQTLVFELTNLRMLVETMLDFPEDGIEDFGALRITDQLHIIQTKLRQTLDVAKQGGLLRDGVRVALVGPPNVGKSSLLNRLSGEVVALVSEIPGTTRDVIHKEIQIEGVPFYIMDTAGLRDSEDVIERMGIALTYQTAQQADLVLVLRAAHQLTDSIEQVQTDFLPPNTPRLQVFNKVDLLPEDKINGNLSGGVAVSAKTGEGIPKLRQKLLEMIGYDNLESGVFMARERHIFALSQAESSLLHAKNVIDWPELLAEELRLAQVALSSITGEFTADDLLGEIFGRFCIGK